MRDAHMQAKQKRLAAQGKPPFKSQKPSSRGQSKKIPRDAQGRPQKYNKNGALVVDQKKLLAARAQHAAAAAKPNGKPSSDDKLKAHLDKLEQVGTNLQSALHASTTEAKEATPDTFMASVSDIRKCLNLK